MWQYAVKVAVTAVVVVAVSELGKRSSFWGAVLASLPLTSLLAFVWMRMGGAQAGEIASLSTSIFWLVLPSLVLFIAFPLLLRAGLDFWASLGLACLATVGAYAAMVAVLGKFGVHL